MQAKELDSLAAEVVQAMKMAMTPVVARLAILERDLKSANERCVELDAVAAAPLSARITVLEGEKALVSRDRNADRAEFQQELLRLRSENAALETRLLELETRPAVSTASQIDVDAIVTKVLTLVPPPQRGEVGPVGERGPSGERGEQGLSGKDAPPVDLDAIVTKVLTLVPAPQRGEVGPMGERGPAGERGEPGSSGAIGERGATGERGEAGPPGQDAAPADVDAIVATVLKQIPVPMKGEKGDPGDAGPVGKDAPPVDETALLTHVLAQIPIPKDGAPGRDGAAGADGLGVADLLIDRQGELVATFTDGRTKALGVVCGRDGADGIHGKDGAPGADGRDVDMDHVKSLVLSELTTWPRPKDGRDGVDGLGFDDFDLIHDEKGFALELRQGDRFKRWSLPIPFDAGVFEPGRSYPAGAAVTADGHFFVAKADTVQVPGEGSTDWRVAVRRGRQGRDGKPGPQGPQGKPGDPGPQGPRGVKGDPTGI